MKFQPHAVSADFHHHAVAVCPGMVVNRLPHISHKAPGLYHGKTSLHTFLSHSYQLFLFFTDLSDTIHPGGICKIPFIYGGCVHIYNISLFQDHIVGRDSVADHLVDGDTHAFGISVVVQRRRNTAHLFGHFIDKIVNLLGGYADAYHFSHCIQYGNIYFAAFPNAFDLLFCLEHAPVRHHVSFQLIAMDFFIHRHMAGFIFFAAATPAGGVSTYLFHFSLYLLFL